MFTGWDKPTNIYFSNFWSDIHALPLGESIRGVGTRSYNFELANGVLGAHMLEVPGGTYTNLHRHGPGAQVLWLRGEGYSMLWPDGGEDSNPETTTKMLATFGYDVTDPDAAVAAFQRHFSPKSLGDPADGALAGRLGALLDLCG